MEQVAYVPVHEVCQVCGHDDEHLYHGDAEWPPREVGCASCPDETCKLPKD
jgi:hypothetical protein